METNLELKNENCNISVKKPRRVLHFSDGTLEEYSDNEEQEEPPKVVQDVVDASKLTWGPWLIHKAIKSGNATLAACDYVGEALASFLGITTPKYQYELDEYMRLEQERRNNENNSRGWLNSPVNNEDSEEKREANGTTQHPVATEQPTSDTPTAV